ncbi:SgrR family transcriptional regulator [Vibrio sinaloensis]|nr:SgrR family transcriptional regulator [Vibrio sinaloensis]
MRYWNALAFCQYQLTTTQFVPVSLDVFSTALSCTRRNAQLLIKRLVKEEVIEWQPGIGRGNHPKAKRLKCLAQRIEVQAHRCLEQGQIEDAIALIHSEKAQSVSLRVLSTISSYTKQSTYSTSAFLSRHS